MRWAGIWVFVGLAMAAGAASAGDYRAPRNALGQPDLEGTWTNAWLTKLERPDDFKTLTITEAEAAAYDKKEAGKFHSKKDPVGQDTSEFPEPGDTLARIRGIPRTSWIYDPADGKIPYTAETKAADAARRKRREEPTTDVEARGLNDRCLEMNTPPIDNGPELNYVRLVQTRTEVGIFSEYNHVMRIVHLGARHEPGTMRRWAGDSVGHWEGETLVVETVNFKPAELGAPDNTVDNRIVERFTRTGTGEITYSYSIENPGLYTQVWRAETVFRASDKPMFEFACHEGNYALDHILAGGSQPQTPAPAAPAQTASK